jgi:Fe2+ or Zn2+ uptake regulation protein
MGCCPLAPHCHRVTGERTVNFQPVIESEQHKVAENLGFTLTGHSLNLYGYCNKPECQDAARKK